MRSRVRRSLQPALERVERAVRATLEIRSGDPLADRFAAFGERSRIEWPRTALVNPGGVRVGDDVQIHSQFCVEALAPLGTVVVDIGSRVYLGYGVRIVAVNGIYLEDDTCIGHGTTLSDTIHAYKDIPDGVAPWKAPLTAGDPLRFRRGAWIGNNSVVTGGITIGECAITAPNSVINRNVPPDTVVGGSPARLMRRKRAGTWEWLVDPDDLDLETQLAIVDRQG